MLTVKPLLISKFVVGVVGTVNTSNSIQWYGRCPSSVDCCWMWNSK